MATYTPIATTTATGSNSITFNSIPQTYTHLVISTANYINGGPIMKIQFNGDTTDTNYYSTLFWAQRNSSVTTSKYNVGWLYVIAVGDGYMENQVINIPNYKNTASYKCWSSQMGDQNSQATFTAGSWENTSAITSVSLTLSSGTWGAGRVTLYGIKGV